MRKIVFKIFVLLLISILFNSCINIEQSTVLNQDGSGTINLHYWTKNSNLSMGEEIGGFNFTEEKIRDSYNSSATDVKEIKLEKNENDSTTHVKVIIAFKDFNKLSGADGFSKIQSSWMKGNNGMDFKYILKKDTINARNLGMEQHILNYNFDFPGEVISSNGTIEGNSVVWRKTIADLKEDLIMSATIKLKSSICGLFGLELPIILFIGLLYRLRKTSITKK